MVRVPVEEEEDEGGWGRGARRREEGWSEGG